MVFGSLFVSAVGRQCFNLFYEISFDILTNSFLIYFQVREI